MKPGPPRPLPTLQNSGTDLFSGDPPLSILFFFLFLALFIIIWSERVIPIKDFLSVSLKFDFFYVSWLMESGSIESMPSSEEIDEVEIRGRPHQYFSVPKSQSFLNALPVPIQCTLHSGHQVILSFVL